MRGSAVEIERRRDEVRMHVEIYGWVCLGDDGAEANDSGHAAHTTMDLTADHIVPVALGGQESGALRVMCRSRNSQLGAIMKARGRS